MTAWYRTGTVTATNGSGTVTGALTAWLANAKVGDAFTFDADSKVYEITAVGSNTSITISPVYAGTTGGSKAYGINRTSTAWNDSSQLALDIANFIATYDPLGLSQLSDPNADRVPFWDNSASAMAWLTLSGLAISGTTISVDTDLMSTARWTTSSIVSATTTNVLAETSPFVTVTGSTGPITSLGNSPNRFRIVRFTGTPTLTYNATTLILPGATNLTVVSGSVHAFASDASGNARWLWSNELTTLTTTAGRALLDDADASAQLTTLGVSTFIKTLLDDTTAAAAQVTLGVREVLTANRTYYVRIDGSDSNNGLANTSGGAFLTIQKLLDVIGALDISIYDVTGNIGAGTFSKTGANTLKPPVGSGTVTIAGAGAASTTISNTSGTGFLGSNLGGVIFNVSNMKIQTTTSGDAIWALGPGEIRYSSIDFGACAGNQIRASQGGRVTASSNYDITGGGVRHLLAETSGAIDTSARTATLTGTPAFSSAFASATLFGLLRSNSMTFSGSATGTRYTVATAALIFTNGGGASYFPGNAAGSATSPGTYL